MFNWAEPGNVAAALAQGRGFSDPFDGGTGPTAWVSPFPVWIEAAVFLSLGVKTLASAKALLALTVLGLAAANAVLYSALSRAGEWIAGTASAAFLAYCAFLPGGPLEVLSEAWVDILMSTVLLWAALNASRPHSRLGPVALVSAAFLAPFENIGLAVATGFIVLAYAWESRSDLRRLALPAAAAAALLASVGAWTTRNSLVLGKPVPLKSNGWFELHLANVDSADGLPRMETVLRKLPFFDVQQFNRYRSLGELAYVASFRQPALSALKADPAHFAANIARRLGAAVVFCRREAGGQSTSFHFAPEDSARLAAAGELIPIGASLAVWTRIDTSPALERERLSALGLRQGSLVWQDWLQSRLAYDAQYRGPAGIALGFLTAGVPVMAFLLSAILGGGKLLAPAAWAGAIAAGMLLPFVLVNHNDRHQVPLLALQAAAIGALAQAAFNRAKTPARAP